MITSSRNTYSSHSGKPLGQVVSPRAPFLSFKLEKLGPLMTQTWSTWNLMSWKKLTKYGTSTLPCLRPAFCHKDKQNYYSDYLLDQVASPWALFYVSNWQNLALGLSMVHLKSDVKKITYYMTRTLPGWRSVFCHKNKQNDHSDYLFKWLLEAEKHLAPMVVTP